MVVEDESIIALNIQSNLESLGYDVPVIVASGEKAVEEAGKLRPDLVLMDIVLAGDMDGVEAAAQIRARFDIPVVYLTAHADDKTLRRAQDTEPFGYILKPFDEKQLHTTVEMALYRHKAEGARPRRDVAQPGQPDEEISQRAAVVSVPDAAAAEGVLSPPTEPVILLIEDDLLSVSLVELVLNREGYQVLTATNGFHGLRMAQATPPDLILLDLMLPGMDGFEVLNRLRADPQTAAVPVMILSAKSQPSDKRTATRIGANAYLTKSYKRAELLALIRSLLEESAEKAAL
jgi:1,2-diacylglycerol 3-beta-glucosyltransferase